MRRLYFRTFRNIFNLQTLNSMPEFSVVIPLYNKEKDIKATLESLFLQTHSNFEVVVVNDGSTDNSEAIVKEFDDQRIRLFSKENEGVAFTRNLGVEKANSKHIVFLDADDYWYPNHLENLHALITKFPEEQWYATAYEKKHNKKFTSSMISPIMENKNWMGIVDDYFKNSLIDALAWTSAVGMKKEFFQSLKGFDGSITNRGDPGTYLRIRTYNKAPLVSATTRSAIHNITGSNRISQTATKNRDFINLAKYEEISKISPYLKQSLASNRCSFALRH